MTSRLSTALATGASRPSILVGLAGAVLALGGCNCEEGQGISRLAPDLRVFDPAVSEPRGEPLTRIDFGEVPLGASREFVVGAANVGTDALRICVEGTTARSCTAVSAVEPGGAPFRFELENLSADTGAWIVEKGQVREFLVTFSPVAEGAVTATLVLAHDGPGRETRVELVGAGVAPRVTVDPAAIDFGDVTVQQRREVDFVLSNATAFDQPFSIAPPAQAAVVFGTADAAGVVTPAGEPFAASIPANGSIALKAWFQPTEEQVFTSTLTVRFCETCTLDVPLRGAGVKPTFVIEPTALDFGTLEEGTPGSQAFVVRNVGTVPLDVSGVSLDVNTTTEFTVTPAAPPPLALGPGDSLRVDVGYVGSAPGEDLGQVFVATSAWDDPATPVNETIGVVSLRAEARGPDIDALPQQVNFGTIAIGGRATRNLSLLNAGNAPLVISELRFAPSSAELALENPPALPATLAPGASVMMTFRFSPQDAGPDSGDLVVVSNDRDEGTLVVPVRAIGGVPTTCSVNVAPSQLTFGLVERGRRAVLPVEIRNGGAQPCSISNLRLTGAPEFTFDGAVTPSVTVAPGSSLRTRVAYAPTAYGSHGTLLEFEADDPGQPSLQVPISGASEQTTVLVIPSSVDFSVVPVTCSSPVRAVTVYNTGNSRVTISAVYLDPTTTPEFELTPFATPHDLPAGGQAVINLRYRPVDIGADTGVLFVSHSGASVPVAVPLSGDGRISPTVTDTFAQLATPQADVLFVVDDSCSMSEEQGSLGSNLGSFLSFAQQQSIDFHLAVTTTDVQGGANGRFVSGRQAYNGQPRVITPQTPNPDQTFRSLVTQGTSGSGNEQGLHAAYLALSDPLINTHNAGFLRPDASLAVIVVSDEEDYSPRQVSFYENFFRNIKGFQNSSQFSFSAVVGTRASGCSGPGGNADFGSRYIDIAGNTGGVVESICAANWGQTLANIGLNSFGLRRSFQLSSQPVPVTISVTVNGQPVPSTSASGQPSWSYDAGTNTVAFTQAATPPAGATIAVTYTVACLP